MSTPRTARYAAVALGEMHADDSSNSATHRRWRPFQPSAETGVEAGVETARGGGGQEGGRVGVLDRQPTKGSTRSR
jgi:hypothetical protein